MKFHKMPIYNLYFFERKGGGAKKKLIFILLKRNEERKTKSGSRARLCEYLLTERLNFDCFLCAILLLLRCVRLYNSKNCAGVCFSMIL
jgi:hypothetical protein